MAETTSKSVLRVCMKSLWDFTRAYNEHGNSVPLPSYIRTAFTNPAMTRRIYQDADLATQTIGLCVGALVANNIVANIDPRNVAVSDADLACLSAILGTESHDVKLLLSHPGAIELTNMIFFTLNDIYFTNESVLPDVLDVVQRTFSILSQALPPKLNSVQLGQTGTLTHVSDGQCRLTLVLSRCSKDIHQGPHLSRPKCIGVFYIHL